MTQLVLSLIQTKQEVPSLALDSALEGQMGGLEEHVRRDHPHLPWRSPSSSSSPWMLKDLLVCCDNTGGIQTGKIGLTLTLSSSNTPGSSEGLQTVDVASCRGVGCGWGSAVILPKTPEKISHHNVNTVYNPTRGRILMGGGSFIPSCPLYLCFCAAVEQL